MALPGAAPTEPWRSSVRVPFAAIEVGQQRRRLVGEMDAHRLPERTAFDASLVLGELVANSIRHARPLPDGSVQVSWGVWDGFVRVEVTDGGGDTTPAKRLADPVLVGLAFGDVPFDDVALDGRGLVLVDAVTSAWGTRPADVGATVWAALPFDARSD